MNKEEIIKQLDKQNIELSEELSMTKDKLNKSEYLLKSKQQELDKYKNIVDELEKEVKNKLDNYKYKRSAEKLVIVGTLKYVLDRLKELKGSDS